MDEFGTIFRRVGLYADPVGPVLRGKSLAEVKAYSFPDPVHPSRFQGVREKARRLYESTGYSLVAGPIFCLDYMRWVLRGLQDSVVDLYEEPRLAEYMLDALVEWMSAFGGALLQEIGEYIDFFWVGDDWGTQQCPFYSPEMFRRLFKPRIAKLIASLKRHTKAKCAYHCCGSVYWAIDDLIETGVDILHPLQPNARDNGDSAKIKAEFGGRLSFHGGTNNQGLFHEGGRGHGDRHPGANPGPRSGRRVHLLLGTQRPGQHEPGESAGVLRDRRGVRELPASTEADRGKDRRAAVAGLAHADTLQRDRPVAFGELR